MHSQSPQIPNQPIMTQGYAQLPGQQHVPMYYQPPPQYAPQPQYQQNQAPQLQQDPNQQALDLTAQQQQPHPPAPQAHQIEETPLISFD
uniref:Uncharacterized protein n=1 Tax=Acrobeloides nanus TaxID=290746 RepID=A0A914DJ83_9BILA